MHLLPTRQQVLYKLPCGRPRIHLTVARPDTWSSKKHGIQVLDLLYTYTRAR